MKTTTLPRALSILLTLAACDPGKPDPGGSASSDATGADTGDSASTGEPTTGDPSDDATGGTSSTTVDPTGDDHSTGELAPATAVDVLFVIDNSGSMAAVQQRIADAIGAFVDPITNAGLDLRIAVTTSDVGNPRCVGNTPENGAIAVTSCRARVQAGEFQFVDQDLSAACLDACAHESITTLPTATADDPNLVPRPWIEWSAGATNVDVPLGEAIACAIPQGVAGCGFEAQLEGMHRAIDRMRSTDDPAAGFLRPEAHFVTIIVTDEMDCSANPEFTEIFTTNKEFWQDPVNSPAPTSAMCWNAGVTCSGGPGTYDDCVATDHALDGAVTSDPDAAVLRSVGRYDAVLDSVQADKLAAGSAGKVQLVVIGGVPVGYPDNPLQFSDGDPDTQLTFGIAPGCQNGDQFAVPPARLREVVDGHHPLGRGLYSICQDKLSGTLGSIAAGILTP